MANKKDYLDKTIEHFDITRQNVVPIVDAMQHDRSLTLEVAGEQQPGTTVGQPHLGDSSSEGLDCEDHLGADHVAVEGEVAGHVRARHVEEVERLDPRHSQTTGP